MFWYSREYQKGYKIWCFWKLFTINQYDFRCVWIVKFLIHCVDMLIRCVDILIALIIISEYKFEYSGVA